jgi:hypothetical protein
MNGWLKDIKDSDKVGLLLLYTGLLTTAAATLSYMVIIFHAGLSEATVDRALSGVKDFFAVGLSLITAAMGVLRFQSKGVQDTSPQPKPPLPPPPGPPGPPVK